MERVQTGSARAWAHRLAVLAAGALLWQGASAQAEQLRIEVEGDDSAAPVQLVVEVQPAAREVQQADEGGVCQAPHGRSRTNGAARSGARARKLRCDSCNSEVGFDPWPWEAVFDPVCAIDETLLSEPGSGLPDSVTNLVLGGAATLLPSVGLRMSSGPNLARLQLSWPWSLPLGPTMAYSRKAGPCRDRTFEMRPIRLMLEPGLATTSVTTLFARPGLRFVFHPADWKTGFGGGFGSTVEFAGPEGLRASASPELLLHWGKCCEPGFLLFTLRYDRYFVGEALNAVSAGVGFGFY